MRTDVKLGIALSTAVVTVVGGYFLFRDSGGDVVAMNGGKAPSQITPTKPTPAPGAADQHAVKAKPNSPANAGQATERKPSVPRTGAGSNPSVAGNPAPRPVQAEPRTPSTPPESNTNPATVAATPGPRNAAPPTDTSSPAIPVTRPVANSMGTRPEDLGPQPAPVSNLSANGPASDPGANAVASRVNEPSRTNSPVNSGTVQSPPRPEVSTPNSVKTASAPVTGAVPTPAKNIAAAPPSSMAVPVPKMNEIPAKTAATTVKGNEETHRIQPGDSLASLSQNYYGSEKFAKFLLTSNPQVRDPNRLTVGTVLKIPPMPESGVALASPSASPAATLDRANAGRTYRVQAGDTFYSISKSVLGDANRWKELLALNRAAVNGDATQLQIGQVLKLPER